MCNVSEYEREYVDSPSEKLVCVMLQSRLTTRGVTEMKVHAGQAPFRLNEMWQYCQLAG